MKQKHSLFRKLVVTLILFTIVISIIFLGTIFSSHALESIKSNSYMLFNERVHYRGKELQKRMTSFLYETNNFEKARLQSNQIYKGKSSLKNTSFFNDSILNEINTITQLSDVTGAFVILDKDVFHTTTYPIIYLRDSAPDEYFADNSDILARYGNANLLKDTHIALEQAWKPTISLKQGVELYDFYYTPFLTAKEKKGVESKEYAYWGDVITLPDDNHSIITYTSPLISDDGVVYGVIGVDYDIENLQRYMDYTELNDTDHNAYTLLKKVKGNNYEAIMTNGPTYKNIIQKHSTLTLQEQEYGYKIKGVTTKEPLLASSHLLNLYDDYSIFGNDTWCLAGIVEEDELFATNDSIRSALIIAFFAAVGISIIVAFYASLRFTKPISRLTAKLQGFKNGAAVVLPPINISEIDELSSSIEILSRNLSNAESRLSSIIQAMDMPIGAIECYNKESVYCTEKINLLLNLPNKEQIMYPYDEFISLMKDFAKNVLHHEIEHKEIDNRNVEVHLIHVRIENKERWLRFMVSEINENINTVVNDVTIEITEKEHLVYERDHDVLTSLLNRRAFHSNVETILSSGTCKEAAMVLWDLDNLKLVNDTYGHDAGDRLICDTADALQSESSSRCIVARMAGDEFLLFYHHFASREEIYERIEKIHTDINQSSRNFGDCVIKHRVSAGIAWYEEGSTTFEDLKKNSDFAMYEVKNTQKGGIKEFNVTNYHKNSLMLNGRQELSDLLENRLVKYAFQPIVSAKDGSIYAYEALMRPQGNLLTSPADVMRLARAQSQLYQVEYLTWTKALEDFAKLDEQSIEKAHLFLNSIPSIPLLDDLKKEIEQTYANILSRLVIELLETDEIEQKYLQTKQDFAKQWNASLAIDDFGSGYNGDHTLLNISAQFIKIDMDFIQGISEDVTRQKLVNNMIQFAHEQSIKVIAEGVETKEDMQYLIHHGIDYLQGYYIGRPDFTLTQIPDSIIAEIKGS